MGFSEICPSLALPSEEQFVVLDGDTRDEGACAAIRSDWKINDFLSDFVASWKYTYMSLILIS